MGEDKHLQKAQHGQSIELGLIDCFRLCSFLSAVPVKLKLIELVFYPTKFVKKIHTWIDVCGFEFQLCHLLADHEHFCDLTNLNLSVEWRRVITAFQSDCEH